MQNQRGETVVFNFIAQIRPAPFVQECFPCRLREVVCDCYCGENAYLSNDNDMLRCFDAFALMLRN